MSKTLHARFQVAEARGEIPEGTAGQFTFATIAETGITAFARAYYGQEAFAAAQSAAQSEQASLELAEAYIDDIAAIQRVNGMMATHSTSDFPLMLSTARINAVRNQYASPDSAWRSFASVTTASDFRTIRSLRLTDTGELVLRPEGTNVTYTTFSESDDGYRVANYERALSYTWEMWKNDEVGAFTRALESLGRGALRTEAMVVFTAIRDGLVRAALPGGGGVPTIARLTELENLFAQRTFTDADGNSLEYGYTLTDIIHGTSQRIAFNQVLSQQFTDFNNGTPNPVAGAFSTHLERLWARVMGRDYVGYDRDVDWLEVAFLDDYAGGPKTFTKIPNVREHPNEGSFENHSLHIKVGHTLGAKVIEPTAAIRIEGA